MPTTLAARSANLEPVIGLEFHVQLATASKMFCGCAAADLTAGPNARTCPVCLGLPGSLPVLNDRAVDLAVMAALALDSRISGTSQFARKNYFYPDLPKGYQITQFDRPLATGGYLTWSVSGVRRRVGLVRIHLEEDAGKSLHDGGPDAGGRATLDFNRSGVPLIEIVTEPGLPSAADAAECFRQLRALLVAIGVTDGSMEHGNLRCDANVSVRMAGTDALGARTEIKNLNSFRFLERALAFEIARQTGVVQGGGAVVTETRLWDEAAGRTEVMRAKESSDDYRYFPEPDLPPLVVDDFRLARLRAAMPETPDLRRDRLVARYGIDGRDAEALAASTALTQYFERVAAASADAAASVMWIRGELARRLHERGETIANVGVPAEALARLITLVAREAVSASAAKTILGRMVESGASPDDIAAQDGLLQESDAQALAALVDRILAAFPEQVAQFRLGKLTVAGFLVGQVMKASGGRANPAVVDRLVRERIEAEPAS
jgi:aspartyl-tRNA(Asn)/glutamyl-tRNA(Gln) amidotransferase subunit B